MLQAPALALAMLAVKRRPTTARLLGGFSLRIGAAAYVVAWQPFIPGAGIVALGIALSILLQWFWAFADISEKKKQSVVVE